MWNNFKTTILLAAMTGVLLAIGQLWGGERGLIFALVLAAVMNMGAYFFFGQDRARQFPRTAYFP